MKSLKNLIERSVNEAVKAAKVLLEEKAIAFIEAVAVAICDTYKQGGKVLIAGNGGSLCDAMHFSEELTGFFRNHRKPLGAVALSDPAHMSCVSNDEGFETVFSRHVTAIGQEGDVFVALSTSGNSENLIKAIEAAQEKGLKTVAFLGKSGGAIKGICDFEWVVEGFAHSDRIQEAHMAAIHIIIEMIENELFYKKSILTEELKIPLENSK